MAIIRGENSSLMPDDVREYMRKLLGYQVPFISIPHADHHVMLDQPIAFIVHRQNLRHDWVAAPRITAHDRQLIVVAVVPLEP